MNKQALFIQAHLMTRMSVAQFGGNYQVTFAAALKIAYSEAKNQQRRKKISVRTEEFVSKLREEIARQRQVVINVAIDEEDATEMSAAVDECEHKFNRVIAFVEATGWVEANAAQAQDCFSRCAYDPIPNLYTPFNLAKLAGF
jgi:hypothetical protein